MRRGVVLGIACVLALIGLPYVRASAQTSTTAAPSVPVVRIASTTPASGGTNPCVSPPITTVGPGTVVFARTGPDDAPLSIAFALSGSVDETSGEAKFAAGSSMVTVSIQPKLDAGVAGGSIGVQLLDGDDYDLGVPATETISVDISMPSCPIPSSTTTTVPVDPRELPHTE